MTKQYLRISEVRRTYGLPRDRVYEAVRRGEVRAINVGTASKASYLIDATDIERWLRSCIVKPN